MKKQGTTDAKRAAANDKPENGKTEKAKVTTSLKTVPPEPLPFNIRERLAGFWPFLSGHQKPDVCFRCPVTIPKTSQQELRRLLRQVNSKSLLNSRTKLFCAMCKTAQRVTDAFANLECKLACGHRREIEAGLKDRIATLERDVREVNREM